MSDSEEADHHGVFRRLADDGDDSPPKRSPQTSYFGAVDENVNLELNGGNRNEDVSEGESSQRGYHERHTSCTSSGMEAREGIPHEGGQGEGSPSASQLPEVADRLITEAGYRLCVYGIKNVKFVLVVGLGLFYVGIQTVFTSLLIPDIARDLCLEDADTGWLRIIIMIGISLGALLQGCVSDLIARRACLLVSLVTAGLCGLVAAVLARSRAVLIFCLCMNGFGIGGILVVALPYYVELLPRRGIEKQIPNLVVFIIAGVAFMSLISSEFSNVIPELCPAYCFANWRIACAVFTALPFLSAFMILVLQIPESPRLLMERCEWTKAIDALTRIYAENHSGDEGETYRHKANELYRIGHKMPQKASQGTYLQRAIAALNSFLHNIAEVVRKPVGQFTDRLVICGCAFAFGYCGWALWLPDYIKAAEIRDHQSRASNISHITISNVNYTTTIENTHYHDITLFNVQYLDLFLSDVHFHNTIFKNCRFQNVVSESVTFSNCRIISTIFEKTDFLAKMFDGSTLENSTFAIKSGACTSEEPFAPTMAYYKICLGHIGGILGVFLTSSLMNLLGSRFLFIASCVSAAVVLFFVFILSSSLSAMAVLLCLQLAGLAGWCALCVHCVLLYPTGKRGTALGLLITMTTLCGLMGLAMVAELPFKTTRVAQVIVTSFLLLVGGFLMWMVPCVKEELIK